LTRRRIPLKIPERNPRERDNISYCNVLLVKERLKKKKKYVVFNSIHSWI